MLEVDQLFYVRRESVTEAGRHYEDLVRSDRAVLQIAAIEALALKLNLIRNYCVPAFSAPMPSPTEAFRHFLRLIPLTTVRALVGGIHL